MPVVGYYQVQEEETVTNKEVSCNNWRVVVLLCYQEFVVDNEHKRRKYSNAHSPEVAVITIWCQNISLEHIEWYHK